MSLLTSIRAFSRGCWAWGFFSSGRHSCQVLQLQIDTPASVCTSVRTQERSSRVLHRNLLAASVSITTAVLPGQFGCSGDQRSSARANSAALSRKNTLRRVQGICPWFPSPPYLLICWGNKRFWERPGSHIHSGCSENWGNLFNQLQKFLLPSHSTLMTTLTLIPASLAFFLFFPPYSS